MLPMMARTLLPVAVACLVLGCGSIEDEDVEEAARATQRTVERGVDGAKRGMERGWDAAVGAYERYQQDHDAPAEPAPDPLEGAAEAIACEVPGQRCTVAYDFASRARSNPGSLAEQVRVRPVSSPVAGIRIDGMRSGSIGELVGMETGDVVTHVNGIAVGTMRDAMLLYMNVRAARQFVIDYRRGDDERTLTVDVV